MAIAISVTARKRRSTKPSRTPFRRPIRFQSSSRRRAGAPVVPELKTQKNACAFSNLHPSQETDDFPTQRRRESLSFLGERSFEKRYRASYLPFGRGCRCGGPYSLSRPWTLCRGYARAGRGGRDNKKDFEP